MGGRRGPYSPASAALQPATAAACALAPGLPEGAPATKRCPGGAGRGRERAARGSLGDVVPRPCAVSRSRSARAARRGTCIPKLCARAAQRGTWTAKLGTRTAQRGTRAAQLDARTAKHGTRPAASASSGDLVETQTLPPPEATQGLLH